MNTAAQPRNDITMQQAANQLNVCRNGLFAFLRDENVLANGLFAFLRDENVLANGCRGSVKNLPFDKYNQRGYFNIDFIPHPVLNTKIPCTHVTPAGLAFIQSLLKANPEKAQAIDRRNKPTKKPKRPHNRTQTPASAH